MLLLRNVQAHVLCLGCRAANSRTTCVNIATPTACLPPLAPVLPTA